MKLQKIGYMAVLLLNSHAVFASESSVPNCEYHKLVVDVSATLSFIAQGESRGSVTGTAADLSELRYECRNGILKIGTQKNARIKEDFDFKLANGAIDQIDLNGTQNMIVSQLSTKVFQLNLRGSSKFSAEGEVEDIAVSINGSGQIDTSALTAKNAKADINGTGLIQIMASSKLSAKINGSGRIEYFGFPTILNVSVNGRGEVLQHKKPN